ncbi:MAG: hypothetical protein KDD27_08920 [Saprospiraceae bacterium]|nr:hypothetical protein [Saprospiraceae bacterium]
MNFYQPYQPCLALAQKLFAYSLTSLFLLLACNSSIGQSPPDSNLVHWSATRKLTVDDFGIKIQNGDASPCFAQYSVGYQVGGFDFLRKNFNQKVSNYMIKSASWIDTTGDVSTLLRYQQTLFDLCEIYTRRFRKALKENRKKILTGTDFIEALNEQIMTDFANRRLLFEQETNSGLLPDRHRLWEIQIRKELDELEEFARK